MKKVKLVYNPMAGDRGFKYYLDSFIKKFQRADYNIDIFRSNQKGDFARGLQDVNSTDYGGIIVAGGDGSVNEVINYMMMEDLKVPLGVIPAGTANDFATHLGMSDRVDDSFDLILNNNIKKVDVGKVNDEYFINVCAGGLLANISHQIDLKVKNTLGKMGYYLKGIEELPNFKPIPLRIRAGKRIIEEKVYLFLILNGKSAGGFNKLSKRASINDGLFELIAIKACSLRKIAILFIKILQGDHLDDDNIIYLKDNYFKIECLDDTFDNYFSDIDGELGPKLPLEISIKEEALEVFTS